LEEYWDACVERPAAHACVFPCGHVVMEEYGPRSWSSLMMRLIQGPQDDREEAAGPPALPGWLSLSAPGDEEFWGVEAAGDLPEEARRSPRYGSVSFPERAGRACTMLPFSLSRESSLPQEFAAYWPLVARCRAHLHPCEENTVGYLTVDEAEAVPDPGCSNSRLGLESPGLCGGLELDFETIGELHFGAPHSPSACARFRGGVFVASDADDATRLYDCRVSDFDGDVCGARGDVERLRPLLDATCASDSLRANELAWFTDRTPHERPPPPRRAARTYFKLVVGRLPASWDARASTATPPRGVCPSAAGARTDSFDVVPPAAAASAQPPAEDRNRKTRWTRGSGGAARARQRTAFRALLDGALLGHVFETKIRKLGLHTEDDLLRRRREVVDIRGPEGARVLCLVNRLIRSRNLKIPLMPLPMFMGDPDDFMGLITPPDDHDVEVLDAPPNLPPTP